MSKELPKKLQNISPDQNDSGWCQIAVMTVTAIFKSRLLKMVTETKMHISLSLS